MQQAQDYTKPLVITEGQLDALALAEAGVINPVSVPNGCQAFTWVPHCWEYVNSFPEVIIFGDCENDAVTLADIISKRFNKMRMKVINLIDYQGCKDANEILQTHGKQAILNAIENAKVIANSRITSMADVEAVDLDRIETFKTSFDVIDKTLGHGIPFGSLTILTGKRGDGKSTFGSQIYSEALNQGYKCFMYSGELSNYVVKGWLDRQLTGMRSIPAATIQKVNNWYRESSFMFDNTMVDDERCDVEELITEAICKYECRIIMIDNLMTAMSGGSYESVFYRQGEFVRHLARIAKKYNVAIILIAHPKKGGDVSDIDTIAGSSDIANAADIIMTYERIEKAPDDLRKVSISKNRYNNGRLLRGDDALTVKYSNDSMRIVSQDKDFIKNYGWRDVPEDGFTQADMDSIPFD